MSEVFEMIVCPFGKAYVVARLPENPWVVVVELDVTTCALLAEEASRTFDNAFRAFAVDLSATLGRLLLVQYDGRVGYRGSELFESRQLKATYGPDDEVWVEADGEGQPIPGAEAYSVHNVPPEDEDTWYVTHPDAIDLGLSQLGVAVRSARLRDVIYEI